MLLKTSRKLIDRIFDTIFFLAFIFKIKIIKKPEEVIIFDLDNTLVNTYPLLNSMTLRNVFRNVKIHPRMIKIFNDYDRQDVFLFILTSRDIKFYGVTKNYLRKNINTNTPVFLVSEPHKKIRFIKYCSSCFNKVTLYDDLSYNHENGEVKFYHEIINEINKLSISYVGYKEIFKINSLIDE
jgi:hypothetical protein